MSGTLSFMGRSWRGQTTGKIHAVDVAVGRDILGAYTALCSSSVKSTRPVSKRPKKAISCQRCRKKMDG